MADKDQYKLVFEGRILEGHKLDDVKKRLSRLLKSDDKKIEQLLAQAPLTIKSKIDYPTASKFLVLIIIGFFLFIGLFIFNIIIVIMAGIKANEGECYRYPMTIRFFK